MSSPSSTQTPAVTVLADGRMDRKNAALYLGLSVKTLAIKASLGTGPKFIKRGRVWYRKEDLDEWLNGGVAQSTAQARHLALVKHDDAAQVQLIEGAQRTKQHPAAAESAVAYPKQRSERTKGRRKTNKNNGHLLP
ncbi:helix-turn-helix transcriptional regulator [Paraburkholderia terrae]|uniref:helix-turn-helix transcriptional regulator n=1 Tax=Paraburkholderia terrae TaxID=311230 RepID=UPI00296B4339|nr:helix-turn-helix domain-containing protein [Paraburkholderia terrae]MDW3660383.1 helix-turn-helix domain-containing protein [Paraburkholderia terrae]